MILFQSQEYSTPGRIDFARQPLQVKIGTYLENESTEQGNFRQSHTDLVGVIDELLVNDGE